MQYSIRQVVEVKRVYEFTVEADNADEAMSKADVLRSSNDPRHMTSQTGVINSDIMLLAEERDK